MPNFVEVLTNIGDFAGREWSPDLQRQTAQPIFAGESRPGQLLPADWQGQSNAYTDDDIRGYRRTGKRFTEAQVRRLYEDNLLRAAKLVKKAFDGNDYARLNMRDAMRGDRRVTEALGISDFPQLFGDVIDRAVLANYRETPYVWNMLAKLSEVSDFRQVKRFRIDHGTGFNLDASGKIIPVAMGQQYPELFPVQQAAWDEMVENWRPSLNIEDRRGKTKKGRE